MEPQDLNEPTLRDRAVRAARGRAPFDVLIEGGTLVDVATGELRAADIGLVGPLIASVHAPAAARAGLRIDARGQFVVPGLIDTHLHIESSMATPRRYAETVVAQGTTTICWDPHELANVMGLAGVRWAIAASRDLPLRVLVLAPSCVPSAPGLERAGASFEGAELREMLSWPEVVGVAEVMDMRGVLSRGGKMRDVVGEGLVSGKLVCGHARGLAGADLQAFAAAGIGSDHEITSGDDLLARLRAGFTVELRGSHDYVLPGAVAALRELPVLPATFTLCTDDVFPDDLASAGGMIDVPRRLVRYGMPAPDALRAATLHAALRLGRPDLGLVAPGRRADIVVLSDLSAMHVAQVFASGRHVASNGKMMGATRSDPVPLPPASVRVPTLFPDDFRLRAAGTRATLRTVDKPRFTAWGQAEVSVAEGTVVLPDDAILMAVIHRHGAAPPMPVLGVLRHWGTWRGALATTVAHDSHNLVVLGRDPVDMAAAANALRACQGGVAVAAGGAVRALLELPVCGLLSDAPTAEVAAGFALVKRVAEEIVDWDLPLPLVKAAMGASLACNPGPHVTDLGIADGSTGEVFASSVIAAE
jgi:adenine deaminase